MGLAKVLPSWRDQVVSWVEEKLFGWTQEHVHTFTWGLSFHPEPHLDKTHLQTP